MMNEFDLVMFKLQSILKESLYCEDGELRIKNKLKYDVYNLMYGMDKNFIDRLHKELEYQDE